MNYKIAATDSGSFVNGVYTTKNGYSGSGLNCPKGGRLYDINVKQPIFFVPPDTPPDEEFRRITQDVCPDVMPYYAISNHGRLLNTYSGKIMKPNYRPNGYEYYCLASENGKTRQKKYSTNRIVMKTFDPREDSDTLQVNHINGDKTQNYYKKVMPDGSIESNLEWATPKENIQHSHDELLNTGANLNMRKAMKIRELRDQGYSYSMINEQFPETSVAAIQRVCTNRAYYDPEYTPKKINIYSGNSHNKIKVTDEMAKHIRELAKEFTYVEIKDNFYPNISISTISDIARLISHNRPIMNNNQKLELKQSGAFGSVSPLKSK